MSYSFELEFEQLEFPLISSEPDCGLLALGIDGTATIEVNDAEDGDWFVTHVQIDVVGSGKAGFFSIDSHNRDAFYNPLVCSFVEDALKKNATHLDEIEDEICVRRVEGREYEKEFV